MGIHPIRPLLHSARLQFCLGLRLLQYWFHLHCLHHVALDLELPCHE